MVTNSRLMDAMAGRDWAWLSRETGIPDSTLSGYAKGGFPRADKAVQIARKLGKSVEWLFGNGPPESAAPIMADAGDADWVNVPQYDLRLVTDASKGNRIETIPIRRDWLNRRLMRANDIWLTELPSDYDAIGLAEGDVVVCSDIVARTGAGPEEGWVCIFRGQGGPFVARYSNRPAPERVAAAEQLGEAFITAADLQGGEVQPVARIHARMLAKL